MFLVGFELIFYDEKMSNIGRENKMATQPWKPSHFYDVLRC